MKLCATGIPVMPLSIIRTVSSPIQYSVIIIFYESVYYIVYDISRYKWILVVALMYHS